MARCLRAIHARQDPGTGRYTTDDHGECRLYGPLTGFVSPNQVYTQLCLIEKTIDVLQSQTKPTSLERPDRVLVYWYTRELIEGQDRFFATSVTTNDKVLRRSAISYDSLVSFAETIKAPVFLWYTPAD
jgi:hypothetical protein